MLKKLKALNFSDLAKLNPALLEKYYRNCAIDQHCDVEQLKRLRINDRASRKMIYSRIKEALNIKKGFCFKDASSVYHGLEAVIKYHLEYKTVGFHYEPLWCGVKIGEILNDDNLDEHGAVVIAVVR